MAIGNTYYDASSYPWDEDGVVIGNEIPESASLVVEGNVGIGTASPQRKLHIYGDWSGIELEPATKPPGLYGWQVTPSPSDDFLGFHEDTKPDHTGRWRMAIKRGGNVGIGTTSPLYKLDVAGTIRAKDVFGAGGKNLIIGDDTYLTDVDVANMLGIYGMQNSDRAGIRLGSDGSYIWGDNGNVGIGTMSPGAKLDVNGNIKATGNIRDNCETVTLTSPNKFLQCPAGKYVTGLYFEGSTWTSATDTHAGPEIYAVECCEL
jgi:hypothetical protein